MKNSLCISEPFCKTIASRAMTYTYFLMCHVYFKMVKGPTVNSKHMPLLFICGICSMAAALGGTPIKQMLQGRKGAWIYL